MRIIVVIFLAVQTGTVDSDVAGFESRLSLRKLLQNSDDVGTKATNATNVANTTFSTTASNPRIPLAVMHVVDEQGSVIDIASTNQNIRLKVKALTTPGGYQSPFIKTCWYDQYDGMPDGESEPLKTEIFVERGCAEKESTLLKTGLLPFEENGVLEVQTDLFNLMPLYGDKFSVLDIHCAATMCHTDITCLATCSKRRNIWKMEPFAEKFELSVVIEVEKGKPTPSPPKPKEKPDLNDFLISGGRQLPPRPVVRTEAPLLKKYQPYFAVSTLGVAVLLLLCVVGIGYMFVSYKNNKKFDNISLNQGTVSGYRDNKVIGLQDTTQGGMLSTKHPSSSPPPAYTNGSAWPVADLRPRSPFRDTCMLTPSEGAILEARELLRNNINAGRLQDPVQDDGARGMYGQGYENGAARLQRNPHSVWNESPERYREPVDIVTSPVGGEWYPASRGERSRSPSTDRLIQKTPLRCQGKSSLIGAALQEYFEKYRM